MVARQNTSRKTKITEGSLYCSTLPYCDRGNKERGEKQKRERLIRWQENPESVGGRGYFADYPSKKRADSKNVIITADFYNTAGRVKEV